jgi:hypothetical protein
MTRLKANAGAAHTVVDMGRSPSMKNLERISGITVPYQIKVIV